MDCNELEKEVVSLQMKISYMEDFMNQIQEVAVEQAKTIEKQAKEIKLMSDRLKDLSEMAEGDIPNRRPPHY